MEFKQEELNTPYAKMCFRSNDGLPTIEDADGVIGDLLLTGDLKVEYIRELLDETVLEMGPCCETYYLLEGEYKNTPIYTEYSNEEVKWIRSIQN